MSRAHPARKAVLVTLGCAKNLVDSEHMVGLLREAGYAVEVAGADEAAEDPREALARLEADVAVVNTCGFIDAAKEESVGVILDLARRKGAGRLGALVVTGCLAQRYADDLLRQIPEVDAVVGTGEFPRLVPVVGDALAGRRTRVVDEPAYRYDAPLPRARLTPAHTAYVKIAEGCNHACAFCVIPSLRGRYRSRPVEAVAAEVEALAAAGVKEVNLVSQDSTFYGRDLAGRPLLPELLARLDAVPGVRWIRVLYNYPATFTPEIAAAMAGLGKVCPYVDLPLQHGSDRVLAAMGRGGGRAGLLERLEEIRAALPGAVLRSSFIVGFPGETAEDFRELLAFLKEAALDYAGFFTYSREEGTPAWGRRGQVAARVKESRRHRAMEVQRRVSLERNRARVGRVLEVLVEGEEPGEPGSFRGRWRGQAPEVDGVVLFSAHGRPAPGDLVPVRITWADAYDLRGEVEVGEERGNGGKEKAP